MTGNNDSAKTDSKLAGFKSFATKRITLAVILALAGLWVFSTALGLFSSHSETTKTAAVEQSAGHGAAPDQHSPAASSDADSHSEPSAHEVTVSHEAEPAEAAHGEAADEHEADTSKPTGWTFVQATIDPMDYELNERFWGWRPNDILNFTDNVNNFQLGVLEVTRRTAVKLAEDISRTGSTAAFDPNLERAMNWFMIRPEKYWFPSAESKYRTGLKELQKYQAKLERGEAHFYNRTDNLIPLLLTFKNLLGSCDDNLVKQYEDNGSRVSFFKSDDYFFYAQGVAAAMESILNAIHHDFYQILETRHGLESLHHAIESCRHATEIKPAIILNSELDGFLANHRANIATAIGHARFYLGVLIITLST